MVGFARLWWAFIRRDMLTAASYRANVLLNVLSLGSYLLIFFFVGRLFSGIGSSYLTKYGGEYLPFVLIGLVLESVAGVALGGFSQAIGSEQYLGTLEPLLSVGKKRAGPFTVLTASALARSVVASWQLGLYFVIGVVFFGVRYPIRGVPLFMPVSYTSPSPRDS